MLNLMTANQSHAKECPFTRMRDHRGEGPCCGAGCMAWRWATDATGNAVANADGDPVGYCGAFGAVPVPDTP